MEALEPLPFSSCFAYLLHWYNELAETRPINGMGICSIDFVHIGWWARLTGREPLLPFEVRTLRRLDGLFCRVMNEKSDG